MGRSSDPSPPIIDPEVYDQLPLGRETYTNGMSNSGLMGRSLLVVLVSSDAPYNCL